MADPDRFGYRRLEVYKLAHSLANRIAAMTRGLPNFEQFEEGEQIRRSSKSVSSQIVEGYGRRKHKNEFLNYLDRALASADETREHLQFLFETGSLKDASVFSSLASDCDKLGAMLGAFIKGVERHHSLPYYLRKPEPPSAMQE